MNPIVQIWLDGQDISGRFAGRVLEARIDETDGEKSDRLSLKVWNGDGLLRKPQVGVVLEVLLGWRETGIAKQGQFKVQEVTKHGEAASFDIGAEAASLDKTLKKQKNRNWKAPKTYGDVFNQLASDNGLSAAVHSSIAQIKIEKVVAQHGESDMHFATRLARSVGAIAKVSEGRLVVVPKGQGQSASGQELPPLVVTPSDLRDGWSLGAKQRPKRGKCKANVVDRKEGKRKTFSAGDESNGPDYVFPHIFASETEAKHAAASRSAQFKRGEAHFRGALRPGLIAPPAGGIIITQGFGDDDDRDWTIKHKSTAFHDGIVISFDCEVKATNPPAKEEK